MEVSRAHEGSHIPLPFDQWDLYILGPFPLATGKSIFSLVAFDYLLKWVEADLSAQIFFFCFGIP